jgi:hypothetical protein
LLTALTAACGTEAPSTTIENLAPSAEKSKPLATESESGTLSFELQLEGDVTLTTFDYAITGPSFSRAGSIDVTDSTTVSARIDGIPAGAGYVVTLSGVSVSTPKAQCSGSAAFDVRARTVTNAPVAIACHLPEVEPPAEPAAVPVPPFASWLFGLALLVAGSGFVSLRTRPKTYP